MANEIVALATGVFAVATTLFAVADGPARKHYGLIYGAFAIGYLALAVATLLT